MGAVIVENTVQLFENSEIVLKVQRPLFNAKLNKDELDLMKPGTLLIALAYALHYTEVVKKSAEKGIDFFAMDMIPRTTLAQKMDALSSQANIAVYKSVILTAILLG
jgi:NAD(P) transhydrogenase subunit alpha